MYYQNTDYGEQSQQQKTDKKIKAQGGVDSAVKVDTDEAGIKAAKQAGNVETLMDFIADKKAMNKFISSLEKKGMNVDYLKNKSGLEFLKAQAAGSALRFYGSDSIVGEDGKVYNGAIASVGENKGKVTGSVKGGLNSLTDDTETVKNWGNMDMARTAVKGIDAAIYKATGKHLSSDQQDKLAHQLASNEEFLGNIAKGHWGKALAATGVQQSLKAFGYNLDKDQLAGAAFATMTTIGVGSGMAVEKGLNAARGKRVATQDIILHDQVDSKGNPKVIKKGQEFNLGTLSDTDKEIARNGSRVADTTVTKGIKNAINGSYDKIGEMKDKLIDKFKPTSFTTKDETSDTSNNSSPQNNNTNNKSKVQDSSEHTTPPNNEFKESVAQKNDKINKNKNISNNPVDEIIDNVEDISKDMPKKGFSRLATHLGIVGAGIELVTAAKTYNDYRNQGMSPLEAAGNTGYDIANDTTFGALKPAVNQYNTAVNDFANGNYGKGFIDTLNIPIKAGQAAGNNMIEMGKDVISMSNSLWESSGLQGDYGIGTNNNWKSTNIGGYNTNVMSGVSNQQPTFHDPHQMSLHSNIAPNLSQTTTSASIPQTPISIDTNSITQGMTQSFDYFRDNILQGMMLGGSTGGAMPQSPIENMKTDNTNMYMQKLVGANQINTNMAMNTADSIEELIELQKK